MTQLAEGRTAIADNAIPAKAPTSGDLAQGFMLGDLVIRPREGKISGPKGVVHARPKAMDILVCLARHHDEVVTRQELIDVVWSGSPVADEPLTRCVSALRRYLGDDRKSPRFLETVSKRGYRLVAPIKYGGPAIAGALPGQEQPRHVLTTVMFVDVVGYSRSMGENEDRALWLLQRYRDILARTVAAHHGRIHNTAGDAVLASFDSVWEGVQAGIAIQDGLGEISLKTRAGQFSARIGLHLGDVVTKDGDLLGNEVNIAARLEPLAEPNGICVSHAVYEQIRNKPGISAVPLGPQSLKNIREPVRAYHILRINGLRSKRPSADADPGVVRCNAVPSKSIAVLPFVNMSGDPGTECFSDGLSEELTHALSNVAGLCVASRTSAFHFKGKNLNICIIGEQLGVRTILEGSVRRDGNRLRVTAQLIDTADGYHLWSARYTMKCTSVLDAQDEISQTIVRALKHLPVV